MNFDFTEEQTLLADALHRCLSEQADFATRKRTLHSDTGWSRALWTVLAELGVPATMLADTDGGLGGGAIELALIARATGAALCLEPIGSSLVANLTLARLAPAGLRTRLAPSLAAGTRIAVPTFESPYTVLQATRHDAAYRLSGTARVVYHAPCADQFLLAACTAGSTIADTLFLIPANTAGLLAVPCTSVDGQRAADLHLTDVQATTADTLISHDAAAVQWSVDVGILALAAETLGSVERSIALTIDYLKTRNQFGGPIGRFQALQHRVVGCLAKVEELHTMVFVAATRLDGEPMLRRTTIAALKVIACETAQHVGEEVVQLHGGMGVTEEMEISHHFRRLVAAGIRFGSRDQHLAAYTALRFPPSQSA